MCVLSDDVDLFFVFSSRFCYAGADDREIQTIGEERSDMEMEAWTRDGKEARMVGYPDRKVIEAPESFCGGIATDPARWCNAVEGIYKKMLSSVAIA